MANVFGSRFRELMREHQYTQSEIAEIFDLTQSTVSRYIQGVRIPKMNLLKKIAIHFDVTVDYLTGNSDFKNDDEILNHLLSGLKKVGYIKGDEPTDEEILEILENLEKYAKLKQVLVDKD